MIGVQLWQFYTFMKILWSYTSLWSSLDDKITFFDSKGVTIGWAIPISCKHRPEFSPLFSGNPGIIEPTLELDPKYY